MIRTDEQFTSRTLTNREAAKSRLEFDDSGKASLLAIKIGALALGGSLIIFGGVYGVAYGKGKLIPTVAMEASGQIDDQGRATVKELDLDIDETPFSSFVAEAVGSRVSLSSEFVSRGGFLNLDTNVEIEKITAEWTGDVAVETNYDGSQLRVSYEGNLIADDTDDRIVARLPLDAISTSATIVPMTENVTMSDDGRSLLNNLNSAWAESFPALRSLPILGAADENNTEKEQTLENASALNAIENVQLKCTPEVLREAPVNTALHATVAEDIVRAIYESDDPAFDDMTVQQLRDMDKVLYIGDESDENPQNLTQIVEFESQYADMLADVKEKLGLELDVNNEFTCEISDEVKSELASNTSLPPGTTLRSQEEANS